MQMRNGFVVLTLLTLLAGLLLAGGCDPKDNAQETRSELVVPRSDTTLKVDTRLTPDQVMYPIPITERPYSKVYKTIEEAWFLIETAYAVVDHKYDESSELMNSSDPKEAARGQMLRDEVTTEIEYNVLGVNSTVEALFLEAIEKQPDNPLNYAAYAYYLKARKRPNEDGILIDTENEAMEQIDKAIEIWPDESSFYLLKIHILNAPHACYEFIRNRAFEIQALSERIPEIRQLFDLAEKYDPDNHMINYYNALILTSYTPPDKLDTVRDEIIREVKTGNTKLNGWFFYAPPLSPRSKIAKEIILSGNDRFARYYDHWTYFGRYDAVGVDQLVTYIGSTAKWPEDKDEIYAVMHMLYQLGRTRPYDRSFMGLQLKILDLVERRLDDPAEEVKLADAMRLLQEYCREAMQRLMDEGKLTDPKSFDAIGVEAVESAKSHQVFLRDHVQGMEAAYLNKVGGILGTDFPLPEDPKDWLVTSR